MRALLLPLALCLPLALVACEPTTPDDDDSAGDDDDSAGDDDDDDSAGDDDDDDSAGDDDDDDSAGDDDDDDSAGDDDDSAAAEPCTGLPGPDSGEWSEIPSTMILEGQGFWPDGVPTGGTPLSWTWYLPDHEAVDAQFAELGPINGGGADVPDAEAMKALFDPATQDLFVITWVEQASGECIRSGGIFQNDLVDCICYGAHLHRDWWEEETSLPAKMNWTVVLATDDLGNDGMWDGVSIDPVWTQREIEL